MDFFKMINTIQSFYPYKVSINTYPSSLTINKRRSLQFGSRVLIIYLSIRGKKKVIFSKSVQWSTKAVIILREYILCRAWVLSRVWGRDLDRGTQKCSTSCLIYLHQLQVQKSNQNSLSLIIYSSTPWLHCKNLNTYSTQCFKLVKFAQSSRIRSRFRQLTADKPMLFILLGPTTKKESSKQLSMYKISCLHLNTGCTGANSSTLGLRSSHLSNKTISHSCSKWLKTHRVISLWIATRNAYS